MKFILASGSPRRRELLEGIGLDFEVMISHVQEGTRAGEPPRDYVMRLAEQKAAEVASKRPGEWIIAADTIVCLDGRILEKPCDRDDAITMLTELAGREHVVYTGLALRRNAPPYRDLRVAATKVRMTPMSPREIEWYVDTGEPMDKAGAYAVQGIGAMLVESIDGNYHNVVGLPLAMLFDMMRRAGIEPTAGARKK